MADDLLTLTKAAEVLGCEASTLRHAIGRGKLKATKYGNTWLVELDELRRYWVTRTPRGWPSGRPRKERPDA